MKRLALLALFAIATLPGFAADAAKPNALTPKEIADGWLLLFDGATTFGWEIDGEARVEQGQLLLGGAKATTARFTTQFPIYQLHIEFLAWQGKERSTIQLGEARTLYTLSNLKDLGHFTGGLGRRDKATTPVIITVPAGSQVAVQNVKLQPSALTPLFNGKDLAGWKEHAGKKSKFAVVDGVINVKDGPGDLQTDGQWADFLLQLDCISNGKQLNSGIFFRCRPGEYQNGYEAQVHNGWHPEATKEYAVDTYDPETGKVVKTDKVKSAAMDFGTGAIYRRVPARKELSKDGEWFTMTVVAQGRHLATWVNGVQTVDWTDTRPVKDNARNGAKLDKGNISIQGHDPTTDLSFRNFRIVELK